MPDTFEVDNPQIKSLLREIGNKIRSQIPPGWGFTLFIFSYGEGGATFYLSTANRDDMIKALREFIAREEK
jgi:hypothetical protein